MERTRTVVPIENPSCSFSRNGSLYLLDEPETPLSPIHQMTLMVFLHQQIEEGCQFLIATHSPMLMAFPGAQILGLDQNPIRQLEWEDVEHVRLMKRFFQDPKNYLRRLFDS